MSTWDDDLPPLPSDCYQSLEEARAQVATLTRLLKEAKAALTDTELALEAVNVQLESWGKVSAVNVHGIRKRARSVAAEIEKALKD